MPTRTHDGRRGGTGGVDTVGLRADEGRKNLTLGGGTAPFTSAPTGQPPAGA